MKKTVFLLLLAAMFAPWAMMAQTTVLFSEGFESTIDDNNNDNYGIPAGWSRDGTYNNSWAVREGSQWAYAGDYYMQSGNGSSNSGKKLISPNLAGYLLSVNSAELRFSFYQPLSSSGYGPAHMRVFYRTAETDPWLQIWECSEIVTDWQLARGIILPDVQNVTSPDDFYQIAFDMQTGQSGCCVFLDEVQILPADKIAIGAGVGTSNSLPTTFSNNLSLSEQIYTSEEVGEAGTILSIDFYCINSNDYSSSRHLNIYMVNVERTEFVDYFDWESVSSDDLVYSGRLIFPAGSDWKTITLQTPFEYDGTSNLLIVVNDNTGEYSSNVTCRIFSSSNDYQSHYDSSNDHSYDPTSPPTNGAGTLSRNKNQIRILKVTCIPPTGLVASNVTDETATLSWTERGDAAEWVLEYADNIDFTGATFLSVSGTPSASLIGLDGETPYYARVKAVCSTDDESPWTDPISFTTDFCPPTDKCEILYELHAAPGEDVASVAWDGAAIRVIDCTDPDNEILLAKLTIEEDYSNYEDYEYDESDDSETPLYTNYDEETDHYSYARGTLPLCIGRNIRFEWESSSWGHDDLYSFEVYDADYNTLFSGIGEYNPYSYTTLHDEYEVNCIPTLCPRPTNVTVNYEGGTTATVTWDNVGSDYDVGLINHENGEFIHIYSTTTNSYTLTGLDLATTYDVQVVTVCSRGDANEEISHTSRTVSFTTDICMPEEMCSISYELHDYESDGWNGAAINVVDASSGIVLDTWTIGNSGTGFEPLEKMTSGSVDETDGYSYANGTLRVCDGRDIQFVWVSGYDDYSCSYVVYDAEDNVILSSDSENNGDENVKDGEDDENDEDDEETDVLYTYTVDCPPCPKPYDLAVDYEGGTTATVTWTGFANSFDISVNDIVTEDVTSPHMLNLELATTYEVKVRADCGSEDGQSVWSRIVSFTTDLCEDVCEIQYELTDAYGDGWNGNGIQIVDVTTEYIYTTLTIENGSTASGTLRVCNGSEIEFRWVEGSWPDECSYIVYGVNEEVIFSGSNVMDDDVAYMVNCGAGVIDANGWYAISAPYYDGDGSGLSINVANIEGLIPTETGVEYDLFRYNESLAKWENQKGSTETGHLAAGFTTLDCGRGYIYRRSANTILSFDGTPYAGPLSQVQTLTTSFTTDENLKGFNLIGNPYQQPIYKGVNFDYDISPSLVTGFYSLRSDGSWIAHTDDDAIAIGEGVLVKVSGSSPVQLSFYDESEEVGEGPIDDYKKGSAEMNLQFDVKGCGHEDVAYAMLNAQHSEGLPKIAHLNAELPSLSIPQGSEDYAIAMIDGSTQAFPLKFRSIVAGEFTLTMNTKSVFGYLHLVDKVANRDIDLLRQPTYTFAHTGNQALANRFMVKLRPEGENTVDIFAYQNDDRIVVEGTGALQVYDVLGRQLFAHEIESQFSILNSQFPSTGVYILRLNGKSQKIVIK